MEKMNKMSLENAIKDEAQKGVEGIAQKEAEELKRLDEACAAEINEFKKNTEAQTDASIRQETSRAESRAALDLKKFRLKSLESFIDSALDEAVKGIRNNPGYKKFLTGFLAEVLSLIPEGAELRLKNEDLVFENDLREALKTWGVTRDFSFVEDHTLEQGGCIVTDVKGGRIFDSSIGRICFQKSAEIRREVIKLFEETGGKA